MALLVGSALLIAGCGGAPAETPVDPASPTPATDATGTPVADPGTATTPVLDPATGLPADPAAAPGATATVPSLDGGGDLSGGLSAISDKKLFAAGAADSQSAGALTSTTSSTPVTDKPFESPTTTATSTTTAAKLNGAVIYVNGKTYTVKTNGTFPTGAPVFRLMSVSGGDIEISLLAGEFTGDHSDGLFLDKGDLKQLVDASEQVTYKIKYLRPLTDTSNMGF
jgi:hypothetical protein